MVGQIRLNADGDIICYTLVASVTKRMRVSSSSLVYVKDRYTQVSVLPVMLAHTTWPCQDPTPMGESQVFIREGWRPLLKMFNMFNLPTTLPKKKLGIATPKVPKAWSNRIKSAWRLGPLYISGLGEFARARVIIIGVKEELK